MRARWLDSPQGVRLQLWGKRHAIALAALSLTLALASVGLASFATYKASTESTARLRSVRAEARQRARVDTARSAQLAWDRKASDHSACLRQSAGRAEVRRSFDDVLDLIAASVPANAPSRARALAFVEVSKATVEKRLPPLKCNTLAPRPTGTRPTIPAVYASCDEAKNAGAAPLHRGDPGYSVTLDADRDGLACE